MVFEEKRELKVSEAEEILDAIKGTTEVDLRDRALIAMILNLIRLSEALEMSIRDVDIKRRRLFVPIRKVYFRTDRQLAIHQCSQSLTNLLTSYLKKRGVDEDPNAPLFPSLSVATANSMIRRRAKAAGVMVDANYHDIRKCMLSAHRQLPLRC